MNLLLTVAKFMDFGIILLRFVVKSVDSSTVGGKSEICEGIGKPLQNIFRPESSFSTKLSSHSAQATMRGFSRWAGAHGAPRRRVCVTRRLKCTPRSGARGCDERLGIRTFLPYDLSFLCSFRFLKYVLFSFFL